MKVFLILASLISLAKAASTANNPLQNDIEDFLEIIPIEKIKKIAIKHLHDDPEFQAAVKYMKSPEWQDMMMELHKQPEMIELREFLKEMDINLDKYCKMFASFFQNITIQTDYKERSLKGFIDEVKQIIPLAKLMEMFDNKMNNSPAFKEFYGKITSERAHQIVSKIRALPIFQKIVSEMALMGVDVDRIMNIVYAVFGWSDEKVTPLV